MKTQLLAALFATTILVGGALAISAGRAAADEINVAADNIGGVVKSAKGIEAGVWVIAQTKDTQTPFIKIVVTDDKGRYLLPELPKANYKVWVRGYGLVDSTPVDAMPGKRLDLAAVVAPDGRAAAQVYPAEYWLALAKVPKGEFAPDKLMLSVKNCIQCHQLGDKATREIPPQIVGLNLKTSLDVWDHRTKVGPAGGLMSGGFLALGDQRSMFADWTDRIAKGEYPKVAPPRPSGVERNVVVTEWDWGTDTTYMHDAAASDVRDPHVNSGGLVYGPSQTDDTISWIDPRTNEGGSVVIPSTAPKKGSGGFSMKDGGMFATSPYWGDAKLWFVPAQPRSSAVDQKGRAWVAARIRGEEQPAFCKTGSTNKYAQYFAMDKPSDKQVAFYDPSTKKVEEIDVCWSADHNQFAPNGLMPGNNLFFGQSDAIGWVSSDMWDKTHDAEASQGWVPVVLDTSGDGKVTKPWTEPDQPIDPKKDHRVHSVCYASAVSPADGSVWCSGVGPTARKLTRISLGSNPPETAVGEQYEPPEEMLGIMVAAEGGVDVDSQGVVWQNWRGTDHVTAFDRRKCKILNGPTATGKHCPEGWTAYRLQGPTPGGGTKLNANFLYLNEVDREGVLGLGKDTILEEPTNSDGLLALQPKTGKWTKLAIPYPMGFLTRAVNTRIDDPAAGWKGRGIWTAFANLGIWHIEGGKGEKPKLVKIQLRPNPLAN